MKKEEIMKMAEDLGYEIVILGGLDEAIIGLSFQKDKHPVVAYDQVKCIELIEGTGKSHEEAVSFFQDKVMGDYGAGSPVFIMGELVQATKEVPFIMYM